MTKQEQIERATRRVLGIRRFVQGGEHYKSIYEVDANGILTVTSSPYLESNRSYPETYYTQDELDHYVANGSWTEIF